MVSRWIPNLAPSGRSGPDKTVAIWRIVMGQQKQELTNQKTRVKFIN
jgi:hypothetical protein